MGATARGQGGGLVTRRSSLEHMRDRLEGYILARQREDLVLEGMRRARDGLTLAIDSMPRKKVGA